MSRKPKAKGRDPREDGALCDRCYLNGCGARVFGEGPERARIAVVGEGPGHNEVESGHPFWGASGEKLEEIALEHGVKRPQMYIDNATLEFPPGGDLDAFINRQRRARKLELGEDEASKNKLLHPADACRPRLFKALRIPRDKGCNKYRLGPDPCRCKSPLWIYPEGATQERAPVIVPTGNAALRALFGFEGITAWRGSPINADWWRLERYKRRILSRET